MRLFFSLKGGIKNNLRIDSGTIGMDSARLHKSSLMFKRNIESNVGGNNMTGSQLTSTFSQFMFRNEERSIMGNLALLPEESLQEVPEEYEDPIEAALERLNSKTKIHPVQTPRSSAKSEFQKMHEKFIAQIMELIFRHKKDSAKCNSDPGSENAEELPQFEPVHSVEFVSTTTEISTFYSEAEFTTFNANGIIKTEDGREINVNISVNMSRAFTESSYEFFTKTGYEAIDPLVINLKDAPAGLTDIKYFFDLDADGTPEEISTLRDGSAFLALDRNNDGIINDGSELFGTKSGDGFKDLAAYDEDGNGWIDENDSIFEKLKIYTKDENGNDLLFTLKEKDIGAICLDSRDTEFTLGSSDNSAVNGIIRRTGIFLYENGTAGTIQHLDLTT